MKQEMFLVCTFLNMDYLAMDSGLLNIPVLSLEKQMTSCVFRPCWNQASVLLLW